MNINEFNEAFGKSDARFDSSSVIMFKNTETGEMFRVEALAYEGAQQDEDGNIINTGSTLWLEGTPY